MSDADPDRLSKPIFHTYQHLRDDLDALRSLDRVAVVDKSVTSIGKSPDDTRMVPTRSGVPSPVRLELARSSSAVRCVGGFFMHRFMFARQ